MTDTTALRVGLYGRQSHGKETSVEDQLREGRAVCARHHAPAWEVARVYRDKVSASRFGDRERGDWAELVADVTDGNLDVLVFWEASRGDRTLETWAAFLERCRARGVLIHSIRDQRTYDVRLPRDWRTLAEDGVAAQYDSEIKSVDVRRGVAGAALAGKAHGPSGYGYTRLYDQHDRRVFTEVPNECAPVARSLIERIAREEPMNQIMKDFNRRGIPSPKGGKWTRRVMRQVAMNPRYIGLRSHNGELHKANWEPIVDEDVFLRATAVLTAPNRKAAAPGALKYMLSYLAQADCGGELNVQPEREGRPARYRCSENGCLSIRVDDLDEYVTRLVLARLARKDARKAFHAGTGDQKIRTEIARIEQRLTEARQSFLGVNGISATALSMLEQQLIPELEAAQKRLAETSKTSSVLLLIGDGRFTRETARPRWDALSVAARRSVIKSLFSRIEVGPSTGRLTRWAHKEERIVLAAERTSIEWR